MDNILHDPDVNSHLPLAQRGRKVFFPQIPSTHDPERGWVPKISLADARNYGSIVELLPPSANARALAPFQPMIRAKLQFFGENDYLVAAGDPSLIALAACYATRNTGGRLRMLIWDRITATYNPTEIRL